MAEKCRWRKRRIVEVDEIRRRGSTGIAKRCLNMPRSGVARRAKGVARSHPHPSTADALYRTMRE